MDFKSNFSYIISFNQVTDDISNLNKVIKWISPLKRIDLIVVEYGSDKSYLADKRGFRHYYLKTDDNYFSRSMSWNIGLKYSISDIVLFSTPNDIMDLELLIKSIKRLSNSKDIDMIKPYSKQYELVNGEFRTDIKKIITNRKAVGESYEDEREFKLSKGITCWKKDSFNSTFLWEENFKFWKEDYCQDMKINLYNIKVEVMKNKGYLLPYNNYHSDVMMSSDLDHYNQLKKLSDLDKKRYFISSYNKSSNLMKYYI